MAADETVEGTGPEQDASQVLREIKADPRLRRIPVVVMHSAARHPFSEPYLRHLGAKGIACKWNEKEVLDAVRNCPDAQPIMAVKPKGIGAAAGA